MRVRCRPGGRGLLAASSGNPAKTAHAETSQSDIRRLSSRLTNHADHPRPGTHHELVQEIRGKPHSSLASAFPLTHLMQQDPRTSHALVPIPSQSPLTHPSLQRHRRLSSTRYAPRSPVLHARSNVPDSSTQAETSPRRFPPTNDNRPMLCIENEGTARVRADCIMIMCCVAVSVSAVLLDDVRESSEVLMILYRRHMRVQ